MNSHGFQEEASVVPSPFETACDELGRTAAAAVDRASEWLEQRQTPEGFWVGMVETNACMESEWLLALHFLNLMDDWKVPLLVRCILNQQRPDGSWEVFKAAPRGDVNATVEAYVALRASGMSAQAPPLVQARQWILKNAALSKIRVFTRYWLALVGEWPWTAVPNIPPEVIFLPLWFPFNIYHFASWARATLLPISVLSARRAVRPLPGDRRVNELFPNGRSAFDYRLPAKGKAVSLERFFGKLDRLLHVYQQLGVTPGRQRAVRRCLTWIIDHQEADGAWAGIQPPWIYSVMALYTEGYDAAHPLIHRALDALNRHWSYSKDGALHIQASESPVWDTLLSLMAMLDCGRDLRRSPRMQAAVAWVLRRQVRTAGDWSVKMPGVEPGGWAFERANLWYPDVDDTAVALIVLSRVAEVCTDAAGVAEAIRRGRDWMLAMQSTNGGWAAFDRDNDKALLTRIPFCDFGETLDPPSADVTAHALEALGCLGLRMDCPAVRRGVAFLQTEQEADGSWFGRWGVNHIYGTGAVLPALKAVGENMKAPYVRSAAAWLAARQNPDGGWGESCESYMDPEWRGRGESTASQTAWALLGLLAAGQSVDETPIRRGVAYLTASQKDGTWREELYTGTGFPGYGVGSRCDISNHHRQRRFRQGTELSRGFMLKYNLYRHYFPLMALGRAVRYLSGR